MSKLLLTLALVVLASILGCAKTSPKAPLADPPAPPAPPATIATYLKQGGIAGFDTKLVVRDDASLAYTDNKTKQTINGTADPALFRQLRTLLANPDLPAAPATSAGAGADLMTYLMIVQTPAGQLTLTTMDATHPAPIIAELQSILDQLWGQARTSK